MLLMVWRGGSTILWPPLTATEGSNLNTSVAAGRNGRTNYRACAPFLSAVSVLRTCITSKAEHPFDSTSSGLGQFLSAR